jgi:hypothetical protein
MDLPVTSTKVSCNRILTWKLPAVNRWVIYREARFTGLSDECRFELSVTQVVRHRCLNLHRLTLRLNVETQTQSFTLAADVAGIAHRNPHVLGGSSQLDGLWG